MRYLCRVMYRIISWVKGILLTGMFLILTCCQRPEAEIPEPANAIYYWRSELRLSDGEQDFLRRHKVSKVYLHLFDVVRRGEQLQPNATLIVNEPMPQGVRIIPIVFLAPNVLSDTTGIAKLPGLLVKRIEAMMGQNELGPFTELQIDFDWTKRNQERYFELLRQIRAILDQQDKTKDIVLSSTIRLHQLGMEAPPVDYGTLMVYNLGRIQDPHEKNSILSEELLRPYLRYLKSYSLPLCTALPVYGWDLLFHDNEFQCILRNVDLQDTTRFEPIDATHYRATRYQPIPPNGVSMNADGRIFPGDIVRKEDIPYDVLLHVKQILCEQRPSCCQQIILYHLDEKQIKQYTDEELQTIYSGH